MWRKTQLTAIVVASAGRAGRSRERERETRAERHRGGARQPWASSKVSQTDRHRARGIGCAVTRNEPPPQVRCRSRLVLVLTHGFCCFFSCDATRRSPSEVAERDVPSGDRHRAAPRALQDAALLPDWSPAREAEDHGQGGNTKGRLGLDQGMLRLDTRMAWDRLQRTPLFFELAF